MIKPEVNANFHHIAGSNILERQELAYREYRQKWEEWPKNLYAGDFPLFIDVEVTSICNLQCPFCATTYRQNIIKKGFINFGTVKKIIDEGSANSLYGIKFNIRGEPLLHKQIHDFVRYAKDMGLIDVYYNTNAMLLDTANARKIIESGLDRISISVEGYTKEDYEKYRVGAEFEIVLNNIVNLQKLKKQMGSEYPRVRIQTVLLPEIRDNLENYKNYWSAIADEVAYLDYKKMKEKKKNIEFPWVCPQPWQRMAVFWDGTILPCNHDDDAKMTLGRVGDISIKQAWHSEKLNLLRQKHKDGLAHHIDACDGCYLRTSEIEKIKRKNKYGE